MLQMIPKFLASAIPALDVVAVVLKRVLNFDWLGGIPVGAAKWVFLLLFVAIGVLVLRIPADYVFEGVSHRRWYRDLRLWGIGVLAFIFVTYYVF